MIRAQVPAMARRAFIRYVPRAVKRVAFAGSRYWCPLCETELRTLLPFGLGDGRRTRAQCPVCGALERHRFAWLILKRESDLFDGRRKRALHIAPELPLVARLAALPNLDYLTADISDPRAMVRMDITDIQFSDGSFDIVFCSHVLEHVDDDLRAMRELRRVLDPQGWAAIAVPINAERTIEDPGATDPRERERLFGQRDHVRKYGPDFEDRLRAAGFAVKAYRVADYTDRREVERCGLQSEETLFLCRPGAT